MQELGQQQELFSSPSGARYFATPSRVGLLQQLGYLLQFGEGVPVVQGPAGAGKTVLASELLSSLASLDTAVCLTVDENVDLAALLVNIAAALGVPLSPETSLGERLVSLRHYAQELVAAHRLAVIVLDDAHNLNGSALGALLSLLQGDVEAGSGLRIAFFSRPGLVDVIDELQLLDVTVFDFEVPFFTYSELEAFFRKMGADMDKIPPDVLKRIWGRCRGNPGFAVSLLREYLSPREPSRRFPVLPIAHIVALAVLVAILVWAVLVRGGDDSRRSEQVSIPLPTLLPPVVRATQVPAGGEEIDGGGVAPTGLPSSLGMPSSGDANVAVAPAREVLVEREPRKAPEKTRVPSSSLASSPSLVPSSAVTSSSVKKPVLSEKAELSAKAPLEKPIAKPVEKPVEVKSVVVKPVVAKPSTKRASSRDEVFLLAQPKTAYTLQVLAASKSESLQGYIQRQPNKGALYLYRGMREGKKRYVVVAGVYESRASALAAIKKLPKEQQKAGPWARPMADVHQEIASVRGE